MTVGRTLRWHDEDRLTPEQSAALSGPGAPFERTMEKVLGADVEVFVQRPHSLVEVLRNSAEQFGDRPYLVFPEETVTFAEVPERAGAIAAVLADEYGVGKGDRVAFASANSLDYALAQLAVVSLGAIIVGLNGWQGRLHLSRTLSDTDRADRPQAASRTPGEDREREQQRDHGQRGWLEGQRGLSGRRGVASGERSGSGSPGGGVCLGSRGWMRGARTMPNASNMNATPPIATGEAPSTAPSG